MRLSDPAYFNEERVTRYSVASPNTVSAIGLTSLSKRDLADTGSVLIIIALGTSRHY